MPSYPRVFSGSSDVASLYQPWITTPNFLNMGAFFGFEMRTGRVVLLDPQLLKKLLLIHSTIILVLGIKDHGKSALIKSLVLRWLGLQVGLDPITGRPKRATVQLHDRKPNQGRGEWAMLVDHLMGDHNDLSKQSPINALSMDWGMDEADLLIIAIQIAETIVGPLKHFEVLALQVAIHRMATVYRDVSSGFTLEQLLLRSDVNDVNEYYQNVTATALPQFRKQFEASPQLEENMNLLLQRPANVPVHEYNQDSSKMAACFGRLLRADYGPMFNGTGSMRSLMSGNVVNLDWTGVTGKAAELMEFLMAKYGTLALQNNDIEVIPSIAVRDEEASHLKNLYHALARDEYIRKARAYPTTDIMITQYPTDLTQIGEAGSALRDIGNSINRGIGMRFVGKMPSDDGTLHELTRMGMSDADAFYHTMLPIGCWGLHIPGQKVRFVQHVLLPSEVPLVETNTANEKSTTRVLASQDSQVIQRMTDVQELQARAHEVGIEMIGA